MTLYAPIANVKNLALYKRYAVLILCPESIFDVNIGFVFNRKISEQKGKNLFQVSAPRARKHDN